MNNALFVHFVDGFEHLLTKLELYDDFLQVFLAFQIMLIIYPIDIFGNIGFNVATISPIH